MRGSLTREQAEEIVARSRRIFETMSAEKRAELLEIARANAAEMTEEEDRAITEDALADPDNPPLDDEFFSRRGRPPLENPKQAVKLRLDADVVSRLRAGGKGWQTRANAILRKAVGLK
jgi:uncharacterized protein (DUF4415 family)